MMMPFRPGLNFGPVGTIEEDLYQVWPFQIKERLIQLGEFNTISTLSKFTWIRNLDLDEGSY